MTLRRLLKVFPNEVEVPSQLFQSSGEIFWETVFAKGLNEISHQSRIADGLTFA